VTASVQTWSGRDATHLRAAYRMSAVEFARMLGVSERMVWLWNAGGANLRPRPATQAMLDEALRRAPGEVQARYNGWPVRSIDESRRWLVLIPMAVPHLPAAIAVAEMLLAANVEPKVARLEATVCLEQAQGSRFQVYCGRPLGAVERCNHRFGHDGPCEPYVGD
jgi:hypothetical protein